MNSEEPGKVVLLDTRSLEEALPGTFWIPSAPDLDTLEVGAHVKVRVAELDPDGGVELWETRPLWFRVDHRDGDSLSGTVTEDADLEGYRIGDRVQAELRHVLDFDRMDRDGRPILNEARARSMIGKRVLIGVTYVSTAGDLIDRDQLVGVVRDADQTAVTFDLPHGGSYSLPPTVHPYEEAAPGEYRLRSTGEVVVDPDFVCRWTITQPEGDSRP